jgi:hypothetical protein
MRVTYLPHHVTRQGETIRIRDLEEGELLEIINQNGPVHWRLEEHHYSKCRVYANSSEWISVFLVDTVNRDREYLTATGVIIS